MVRFARRRYKPLQAERYDERMTDRQRSSAKQCAGAGLLCCYAAAAWSAPTDECRAITDDARRLACYDQLFSRPAQPVATSPGSPQQKPAPDPTFGLTEAQQRASAANGGHPKIDESILATVANLRNLPGGQFVVTLDNGQVWRQIDWDSWSPPQKGDRVTIRRGALGSFMLVTAKNLATHVRRDR
jgi:hypothetical protein